MLNAMTYYDYRVHDRVTGMPIKNISLEKKIPLKSR